MKYLSAFINLTHDKREGREPIEWANIWYSKANSTPNPDRVLF